MAEGPLLAASFSEAVVLLHVRGRKLGRFVYLPRTDRWMVVPLPDPRLERPIGVLVEVVLIDEQEQRCG